MTYLIISTLYSNLKATFNPVKSAVLLNLGKYHYEFRNFL